MSMARRAPQGARTSPQNKKVAEATNGASGRIRAAGGIADAPKARSASDG